MIEKSVIFTSRKEVISSAIVVLLVVVVGIGYVFSPTLINTFFPSGYELQKREGVKQFTRALTLAKISHPNLNPYVSSH